MGHHHGSDTSTSARSVLLHTDQKGPNILTGSVSTTPLWQWGFRQCLPFSWKRLKGKHCTPLPNGSCRYVWAMTQGAMTPQDFSQLLYKGSVGVLLIVNPKWSKSSSYFIITNFPLIYLLVLVTPPTSDCLLLDATRLTTSSFQNFQN